MQEEKKITVLNCILVMVLTAIFIYLAMNGIEDLTGMYKIEKTIRNTKELRIAIEKYYQQTGDYPDLTRDGANNNLNILDYVDREGKKISFAEIYGKKVLDKTYSGTNIQASNEVYDVKNFEDGNKKGGWNYNYSQKTGEIHANLSEDIYLEKVNWEKQ